MGNVPSLIHPQRWRAGLWLAMVCFTSLLLLGGCSSSDLHLSFLDPQGPVASVQRWHFYKVLAVLVVFVAIPVFAIVPFFLWRYRYGAKSAKYTPQWDYSRLIEIFSWGGPVLIVVLISIVVWQDTHALDPYKPLASDQPALRVQAIGYDWKWLFIYPDQGIASVGMLAMPVGRPLAFDITSATVMQSLFIPALGSQIYAMGGMVTKLHLLADKPGRSLGENTMYNGYGFHQQKFTAVAMTPEAFQIWADKARATGIALNERSLKAISQRGTHAQLITTLQQSGQESAYDKNLYFSGASPALFSAVVKATKDGTAVVLTQPFGSHTAAQKPPESTTENKP